MSQNRSRAHSFGLRVTGPVIDTENLERLLGDLPSLRDWEFAVSDVEAVLDEFGVPRESGGIELSVTGRIRALWSKTVQETNAAWAATCDSKAQQESKSANSADAAPKAG